MALHEFCIIIIIISALSVTYHRMKTL